MKNVMEKAWEIYRTLTGDHTAKLAMALRQAWAEVKKSVKNIFDGKATVTSSDDFYNAYNGSVSFRLWENYGKKRIYFDGNGFFKGNNGYIDCDDNNEIVAKRLHREVWNIVDKFIESYAF